MSFPSVKLVFMRYNTAIPSSAAVERLYSSAGLIANPRRNRLTDFLGQLLRVDLIINCVSNVRPSVRPSVRPQNVSSISVKFGVYVGLQVDD